MVSNPWNPGQIYGCDLRASAAYMQGVKRWLPERLGHVDFGGGHVDVKFICPMGINAMNK